MGLQPHHPIVVCLDGHFYRRLDPPPHLPAAAPPPPTAADAAALGNSADAAATCLQGSGLGGAQAVVSVVGKAYGRMGLVRAARALCSAGAAPADVTGEALAREMLRPLPTPTPGGPACAGERGGAAGDGEWAAAAAASEPELAINVGPPGVCGDFLPWQVRALHGRLMQPFPCSSGAREWAPVHNKLLPARPI